MANYTMTLGDLNKSGYTIFDFDYPCIAGYRTTFENKFLLNFYDREINFLSADEFKRHLNARLNLIMPYYVQLQKSEHLIENPFRTYKMVENTHRSDDERVFANSVDSAALTEGISNRIGQNIDLNSLEGVGQNENSNKNGTLDRKTADSEVYQHDNNYTEDETGSLDRDTTDSETTNRTINEKFTDDGTKKMTYLKDKNGTKTTLFSDTPQENFVLGDSDERGNPLSSYATTYTRENTTEHESGSQNDTTHEESNKDTKDDTTKTSEGTQDDSTTRNLEHNQDESSNTNAEGTLHDVTHEVYEDSVKRQTDFRQNTKTSEQRNTDRVAENSEVRKTDRMSKAQAITAYGYEGYKQITESAMLRSFRETFLNIDRDIFRECETLFLGVY